MSKDYFYWMSDEITQAFIQQVQEEKRLKIEAMAKGVHLDHESSDKIATQYAFDAGYINALDFIEAMINAIKGEISNESNN